ncbi:hypothetical protein GCM10011380_22420 [Sphingomonas metalli]|uniref:Transmembrane protein n=1 Tax=Sphingomonas metalli TaxID=1779358 RepID=A0A916T7W1_9SPHN|nr:hypothetical protein [Sphingomonas metalli]GGB32532.1 hypothetical protein GCM10011380_22420 [Sphingomonas metalli]
MLKTIFASSCAAAMCVAPAYAAPVANPAQSLSVSSNARVGTPARKSSQKLAAPGAVVGLVLAAAIVAGGVIIAVDDDDNSDSN